MIIMKDQDNIEQAMRILKENEPSFSHQEKDEMWSQIKNKYYSTNKKEKSIFIKIASIAAAAAILFTLSWGTYNYLSTHGSIAKNIDINTNLLTSTTLYLDDNNLEMGNNADIYCIPEKSRIQIKQDGGYINVNYDKKDELIVAVPKAKRAKVHLADGSVISLFGGSILSFYFDGDERKASLNGEGYFDIMHDQLHPFITKAGELTIRVLGTEYIVEAYNKGASQSVSLISGKVEVTPTKGKSVTINPGQAFVYTPHNENSAIEKVDIQSISTWKENIISLQDICLTDLLLKVEKLYDVEFNYNITDLQDIHITGKLDTSVPIEIFLKRLSHIAPIQVEKRAKEYTITYKEQ